MTTRGRILGLMLMLAVPAAAYADDVGKGSGVGKESSGGSDSGSSSSGSSGGSSGGGGGERAVPRDSGYSGGHDSGARRPSSEGTSSSSAGRNRGGYSGDSSSTGKEITDAERRHPRAGAPRGEYGGRGGAYGGRGYDGRTAYYGGRRVIYGHYGSHYHGSIFYPYTCYHDYWDYPYRNRYYSSDPTGAVRVLVEPNKTKVYVDGYYAGIADDFDGIFQRLYLPPGRHEIALKLEGYRTHRVQIYSARGHTIKLHHDMAQGEGEDEPVDMAGPMREEEEQEMRAREEDQRDPSRRSGHGTLRLEITPKDASVYVDGEFWGSDIDEPLRLPVGRHEIAVVRPGFQSIEREVEIRSGESFDLEIDLRRASRN